MTTLTKEFRTLFTPGSPGTPGNPGSPAVPAYCYEESGTDCIWVFVPLGGDDDISLLPGGYSPSSGGGIWIWECGGGTTTICVPAQDEVPATPATPPTPAELSTILNKGWNSHSRSIGPIQRGQAIKFQCNTGISGLQFVVGEKGRDWYKPGTFDHNIFVDVTGGHVLRGGVELSDLDTVQLNASVFYIIRAPNNDIWFYCQTAAGGETWYKSTYSLSSKYAYITAYAWLYSGGDKVIDAEIVDFSIVDVDQTITLSGAGSVSGYAGQVVYLNGAGSINIWQQLLTGTGSVTNTLEYGSATLSGEGGMYCYIDAPQGGSVSMPALQGIARDDSFGTGWGASNQVTPEIAALTIDAYTGEPLPADPQLGYGNILPLVEAATMKGVQVMSGDVDLPAVVSKGGEKGTDDTTYYGEAGSDGHPQQNIGPLTGLGAYPLAITPFFSTASVGDESSATMDLLIVFTSTGQIADTYTGTREVIAQFVSSLTVEDTYTLAGILNLDAVEEALVNSEEVISLGSLPAFEHIGSVWCVNMETGASSQYEDYNFTDWFERDGIYYGIAHNGIYKLGGTTDLGTDISQEIDFGETDCGIKGRKKVLNVHVGTSDGTNMYLKVTVDGGTETVYQLEACRRGSTGWRAKIPQNIQGMEWRWKLVTTNDVELDRIEFAPAKLSRRL